MTYWINVCALLGTAIIATIAVFSKHFDDNTIQRVGLALISMTCFGRVTDLVDGTNAAVSSDLVYVWKNTGIFLFALGTFVKFSIRTYVKDHMHWVKEFPYDRRKSQ